MGVNKEAAKELYNEFARVAKVAQDIANVLVTCDETTNLKEKVGVFARLLSTSSNIPERYKNTWLSILRQTCTGEISVDEATKLFSNEARQLNGLLEFMKA